MGLLSQDFEGMYAGVVELLDTLEIPRGLSDLQVPEKKLDIIAEKAFTDAARSTNPVSSSVSEIRELLEVSFYKAR